MTGLIRFNGGPAVRWNPVGFFDDVTAQRATDFDRAVDSLASRVFGNAVGAVGEMRPRRGPCATFTA